MTKKMFKVLCPIERDGKTHWIRTGTGFTNKDDSINIVLDVLPTNGKLHLRDFDEEDRRTGNPDRPRGQQVFPPTQRAPHPVTAADDVPF